MAHTEDISTGKNHTNATSLNQLIGPRVKRDLSDQKVAEVKDILTQRKTFPSKLIDVLTAKDVTNLMAVAPNIILLPKSKGATEALTQRLVEGVFKSTPAKLSEFLATLADPEIIFSLPILGSFTRLMSPPGKFNPYLACQRGEVRMPAFSEIPPEKIVELKKGGSAAEEKEKSQKSPRGRIGVNADSGAKVIVANTHVVFDKANRNAPGFYSGIQAILHIYQAFGDGKLPTEETFARSVTERSDELHRRAKALLQSLALEYLVSDGEVAKDIKGRLVKQTEGVYEKLKGELSTVLEKLGELRKGGALFGTTSENEAVLLEEAGQFFGRIRAKYKELSEHERWAYDTLSSPVIDLPAKTKDFLLASLIAFDLRTSSVTKEAAFGDLAKDLKAFENLPANHPLKAEHGERIETVRRRYQGVLEGASGTVTRLVEKEIRFAFNLDPIRERLNREALYGFGQELHDAFKLFEPLFKRDGLWREDCVMSGGSLPNRIGRESFLAKNEIIPPAYFKAILLLMRADTFASGYEPKFLREIPVPDFADAVNKVLVAHRLTHLFAKSCNISTEALNLESGEVHKASRQHDVLKVPKGTSDRSIVRFETLAAAVGLSAAEAYERLKAINWESSVKVVIESGESTPLSALVEQHPRSAHILPNALKKARALVASSELDKTLVENVQQLLSSPYVKVSGTPEIVRKFNNTNSYFDALQIETLNRLNEQALALKAQGLLDKSTGGGAYQKSAENDWEFVEKLEDRKNPIQWFSSVVVKDRSFAIAHIDPQRISEGVALAVAHVGGVRIINPEKVTNFRGTLSREYAIFGSELTAGFEAFGRFSARELLAKLDVLTKFSGERTLAARGLGPLDSSLWNFWNKFSSQKAYAIPNALVGFLDSIGTGSSEVIAPKQNIPAPFSLDGELLRINYEDERVRQLGIAARKFTPVATAISQSDLFSREVRRFAEIAVDTNDKRRVAAIRALYKI